MLTRAEYLTGSISRQQPWLAEGISRRTWERRRSKSPATPLVTRAEYLAGSISRQQPWLAEGISRRTWERRRSKITAATGTPAANQPEVTNAPAKGARTPANKAPRAALGPANDISAVPAHKRTARREAEDLLLRRIHSYWDARGMMHSDPQALAKAIHAIILPAGFKYMDGRALRKAHRKARGRLPAGYESWIGLVAKWDNSYTRQKARDLVDRRLTAIGDRPRGILDRIFAHLERQICDHLPKKVRRLEHECGHLEKDECYTPQLRSIRRQL